MRRALAIAVAALLAGATPAAAQDEPEPVIGGGSFNAAPLLEPGAYRDTVLTGEYLYYAIAVQPGQRIHVRARVVDIDAAAYDRATALFTINLHTPQREEVTPVVDEDVAGNGNTDAGIVVRGGAGIGDLRWDFYGPPAQPFAAAADGAVYDGPGTWYVSLHPVAPDTPATIEIPVELELAVDGAPLPEEPDPQPTPSATPTPAATPAAEDGDEPGTGALVGIGAIGLAVGLIMGRFLRR
jgi:Ca-activated chloride channel family protein